MLQVLPAMQPLFVVIALLFSGNWIHLVLGAVGRIVPPTVIDIANNALHHNSYVDQRIRMNPHDMLNHQQYHQRNVDPDVEAQAFNGPPASAADPSAASSSYQASSTASSGPTSSSIMVAPAASSIVATASSPALSADRLSPLTKAVVSADRNTAWNNQTDMACMQTLTALNGTVSNPAGIAACYNIRTFDNSTGAFQVGLRLYRICPSSGDWATLKTPAVNVALSYTGASIATGSMNKVKRDRQVLSWPIDKRDPAGLPHILEDLTFVGKIHEDQLAGIKNEYVCRGGYAWKS